MSIKLFSVIIVLYNNEKTIESCLASIFRNKNINLQEVIVVDNASSDDSLEIVENFFPLISIIRNKNNLGFAKANNQALKQAKGNFIFLLNPDTEVISNALEEMVAYMEKHDDVGILGPKLINADGSVQKEINSFPKLLDSILVLLKLHRISPFARIIYPNYDYKKTQEAEHLMGSVLLIRKEVFEKIGFFDEKFFLWFEETDFEKRAKEAGFKIVYYPRAVVKHLVGHSTKQLNPIKRQAIWNQSLGYYFQKHRPKLEQVILTPFIILSYVPAALLLLKEKLLNK